MGPEEKDDEGFTRLQRECDENFGHDWGPDPIGDEWVPCRICGLRVRRYNAERFRKYIEDRKNSGG